jgi:fructokinase
MILVCGEALMDVFINHARTPIGSDWVAGGSSFNVAMALAALQRPVSLVAGFSQDPFGQHLKSRLKERGVELGYAVTKPERTTLALVQQTGASEHSFSFYGGGADVQLLTSDLPKRLPFSISALALGSYSLFVEPIGSALRDLVERESMQRLISIDLNLRPAIVGELSDWAKPFDHFLDHAHIVKASLEDLHLAYGPDVDPQAVADRWLARGVPLVLLTLGAKGARVYYQGQVVTVPGFAVDVVDTVGAGDVFHAAFLAWFDARKRLSLLDMPSWQMADVIEAMLYAVEYSARVCTVRGCDVSILLDHPSSLQPA